MPCFVQVEQAAKRGGRITITKVQGSKSLKQQLSSKEIFVISSTGGPPSRHMFLVAICDASQIVDALLHKRLRLLGGLRMSVGFTGLVH